MIENWWFAIGKVTERPQCREEEEAKAREAALSENRRHVPAKHTTLHYLG